MQPEHQDRSNAVKRLRVGEQPLWETPFAASSPDAMVMVALLQMVRHIRADDGLGGTELVRNQVRGVIKEKTQAMQSRCQDYVQQSLTLDGTVWARFSECQTAMSNLRAQLNSMLSHQLFEPLVAEMGAIPLQRLCCTLPPSQMRELALDLLPAYGRHVTSVAEPPTLRRGLPKQLLLSITQYLTSGDVLYGLGCTSRAWFRFCYWNVYAMAGTAFPLVVQSPATRTADRARWQLLKVHGQRASVVQVSVPYAGWSDDALRHIDAARLEHVITTADQMLRNAAPLLVFLNRHRHLCKLTVRDVSMSNDHLRYGKLYAGLQTLHEMELQTTITAYSFQIVDLQSIFWHHGLSAYPRVLRVRVYVKPAGLARLLFTQGAKEGIKDLYKYTMIRIHRKEMPGVERLEILLVVSKDEYQLAAAAMSTLPSLRGLDVRLFEAP